MYINLKTLFIVNFSINFPCTMGDHFLFSPPLEHEMKLPKCD